MKASNQHVVVYLGPSLPRHSALRILDADYRPPIRRGDIDALLAAPPQIVGIIDGQFFQELSVSPKEILRALDQGIAVYGASSMGALRAAELYPFGMIGVGKVYELYRSGRIDADDEVAITHTEQDWYPLSEPLVNIRFALQGAVDAGIVSERDKRVLVRIAKGMYFPERSYSRLLEMARDSLPQADLQALGDYLSHRAPDVKREDAVVMLSQIRRLVNTQ